MATSSPKVDLYDGALKGNLVGEFVKDELQIQVIRPGYDSQGGRRPSWTQFLIDSIPIYEVRVQTKLPEAISLFESNWDELLSPLNPDQRRAAINAVLKERRQKFADGVSGKSPAPAITTHGATSKRQYVS